MISDRFRSIAAIAMMAIIITAGIAAAGSLLLGGRGEPEAIAARRERIAHMEPDEKARLHRLWERFGALSPAEQEKLRQLEREIGEDAHAVELRKVMRRYYRWSMDLPTYQRLDLLELPARQQLAHIGEIKRNAEDAEGLKKWFDAKAERIAENLSKKQRNQLSSMGPAGKYMMLFRQLANISKGADANRHQRLSDRDLADLRSHLSEQTRKLLESKAPAEQWKLIVKRLHRHFRTEMAGRRFGRIRGGGRFHGGGPSDISDEEFARLFEKLPRKQQDLLLSLPADEMRQQLQEFYLNRRFPRVPYRNGRRPPQFKVHE